MKPLAARAPRTRRLLAVAITVLALALPLLAVSLWLAALSGQHEQRAQRLADVQALQARVAASRAELNDNPRLALVADPGSRARLRSLAAAQTHLTAQATRLADRLIAAGAEAAPDEARRTVLGGIDEVRVQLTATGRADAMLQALAAGAEPDLRVFSFRLEPLADGQARLVLVLTQAAAEGGSDAD